MPDDATPSLITLTTDFEEQEPFAAILKGILASRSPGARIVDLSHHVPRGDVMAGALFIATAIPYFPQGTIHLVNVAPRDPCIVVAVGGQTVVCCDNGITTLLAERYPVTAAHTITVPEAIRARPGQTFYGRDLLAPAAARLANGEALAALGPALSAPSRLEVPRPAFSGRNLVLGEVMHIDRFGNLMSNIHSSFLEGFEVVRVDVGGFPIGSLSRSYADVAIGKPLAIFGNSGYLEVAYNGDRADRRLEMGRGIVFKATVNPVG